MSKHLTLQTLMAAHPATSNLNLVKRKVYDHILACGTERMGGLQLHCDQCEHRLPLYHACRDRHCPRCQFRQRQQWCERQQDAVLPVTYYHLVFTLPHDLNGWVQLHPKVIYQLLFQCVWATLKAFGADPKRLNGELGATMMLHTWGQNLSQHVHLHCLIPGGALTRQGDWKRSRSNYLFPVRALSRHFRGKMVSALRTADQNGDLNRVTRADEVDKILNKLMANQWVVYSKACITRTETVIDYLGRYSHRIALSNSRLLGEQAGKVLLRYKDYRDGKNKVLRLTPEELIRRFLLHVLPRGLMRIRHYGFLANCCRKEKLSRIRSVLKTERESADGKNRQPADQKSTAAQPTAFDGYPCPKCKTGKLLVIAQLPRPAFDSG
jgi:hypothetical protein